MVFKKKPGEKTQRKGVRSAAMADFAQQVAQRYRTITLSEYLTSQKCAICGSQLVRTRGHSFRYWQQQQQQQSPAKVVEEDGQAAEM